MTKKEVKDLVDRTKLSFQTTEQMRTVLEQAYRLGAPDREGFNRGPVTGGGDASSWAGERKQQRVFDSTYQNSIGRLTNDLVIGMFPPWAPWARLSPGPSVSGENKRQLEQYLQEPERIVQRAISASNFDTQVHPVLTDLVFSTGVLLTEPHAVEGIVTTAVPPWELGLEQGATGRIEGIFRKYEVRVDKLNDAFPDAQFPPELLRKIERDKISSVIVLSVVHKYGDRYYQHVIWNDDEVLVERGPFLKNPYSCARWSVLTGEAHGRGPAVKVYPAAYTLNELMRLYLINTNFAVYGLYTVLNDGVVNPSAFQPKPFAMLPVGSNERSNPTLSPIPRDHSGFEMADRVIDRMQSAIKSGLFVDDLGDVQGPRMTATEISERQAMIAKDKGAGYGRITNELNIPFVERVVEILQDQGALPKDFRVDGKIVQVQSISPLSRAQQFDQIQQNQAFLASCASAAAIDPAAMALPNVTSILRQEALFRGVDVDSLHGDEEIAAALTAIGQAKALAATTGNDGLDPTSGGAGGISLLQGGMV